MTKFEVPYWCTVWKNGSVSYTNKKGKKIYLSLVEDEEGFLLVDVMYNRRYRQYVHRLVAEKYLDNPNNYEYILFKDGNIKNVHVDNLEWCP